MDEKHSAAADVLYKSMHDTSVGVLKLKTCHLLGGVGHSANISNEVTKVVFLLLYLF